jgi:hypothetical protein
MSDSVNMGQTGASPYPPSVEILREVYGTILSVREITQRTAKRMNCTQFYDDVAAVLDGAFERGEVKRIGKFSDFRDQLYRASDAVPLEPTEETP